ncbi:MAG: flavin-binding protein [Sphingomonas sp.]|nr:flavin-binding protein [Sphingomonas sp.]RZV53431.1 MAG: flavin-binding protein [Sphingomonadaceae bacterium]
MHVPVVGTADGDMRIMVLRDYDPETRTLRFHTDARSPKVATIEADPAMGVLFYDKAAKVQIRCRGRGRIERTGAIADAAWAAGTNFAKRCYLAPQAPSSASEEPTSNLPSEYENAEPDDAAVKAGRENFSVLLIELERIDWLHLAHSGHRRAVFDGDAGHWVAP